MAANTILLIAIAAMAVLLFAGTLAVVVYKTRTEDETIRDRAEKNARDIRHQEALADEYAAEAHAAQVEVDVKRPGLAACDSTQGARLWHAAG